MTPPFYQSITSGKDVDSPYLHIPHWLGNNSASDCITTTAAHTTTDDSPRHLPSQHTKPCTTPGTPSGCQNIHLRRLIQNLTRRYSIIPYFSTTKGVIAQKQGCGDGESLHYLTCLSFGPNSTLSALDLRSKPSIRSRGTASILCCFSCLHCQQPLYRHAPLGFLGFPNSFFLSFSVFRIFFTCFSTFRDWFIWFVLYLSYLFIAPLSGVLEFLFLL